MTVILDDAHGVNVLGKQSPDGRFKEYLYSRKVNDLIQAELESAGFKVFRTVTSEREPGLSARCRAVNNYIMTHRAETCFGVSTHTNASASDGQWHKGCGVAMYVAPNASQKSKRLAACLFDAAEASGMKMRRQYADKKYWVQSLAICRDTICPFVLTETGFQDNLDDVEWLLSDEGLAAVVAYHVEAVKKFAQSL